MLLCSHLKQEGQRPKTCTPGPFGPKNKYQVHTKIYQVKNAPHEPCHRSVTHCVSFCRIKRRHTRVCLLSLTFNCFCRFAANQRSSIVPPYAPYTNDGARGDPIHPPQPTRRHTSNTRICLLRGGRTNFLRRSIDRAYLDFGSDRHLPSVAMEQNGICMSYLCITAEVCRQ